MSALSTLLDTAKVYLEWAAVEWGSRRPAPVRQHGDKHSVLMLASAMPPVVTGGVYRPLAVLRAFDDAGWDVDVVTGPLLARVTEAGEYLAKRIPPAVRVHRLGSPSLQPSYKASPRVDGGFITALDTIRFAERLGISDKDVIYATGPSFHNFIAGYFLARRHGAKLVLSYRDEWTECPFPFVQVGNLDRFWEKRCLRAADLVLTVTESIETHHLNVFDELSADRSAVILNGWDEEDMAKAKSSAGDETSAARPNHLDIVFTGFMGSHTLPDDLFRTLETVFARRSDLASRFKLRLIGQKTPEARASIAACPFPALVESVDQLPKPEVLSIMRQSNALLILVGPALARALPGKFFDYMASESAILSYGSVGEIAAVMQRTGAGVNVPEGDDAALESALDQIIGEPSKRWMTEERARWCREHTRANSGRRIVAAVADVLNGKKAAQTAPATRLRRATAQGGD